MIVYALPFPTTIIAMGAWLTAQSVFGTELHPGELIGGGIVTVVGFVALRMILTAAKHERIGYLQRIEDLEKAVRESRADYHTERTLRLSLEEAGITDRRRYNGDSPEGTPI